MRGLLDLLKLGIGAFMCSISLYSLVQTPFYEFFMKGLKFYISFFDKFPEIVPLALLGVVLFFTFLPLSNDESIAGNALFFSFLFFFPSILAHSHLNWFGIFGLDLQVYIPLWEVFLIGTGIIVGYLFLYFIDQIEDSVMQLQHRGGSTEDTGKLTLRKLYYTASFIGISFGLSLLTFVFVDFFGPNLRSSLSGIAPAQLIVIASAVTVSIVVAFYVFSEAEG